MCRRGYARKLEGERPPSFRACRAATAARKSATDSMTIVIGAGGRMGRHLNYSIFQTFLERADLCPSSTRPISERLHHVLVRMTRPRAKPMHQRWSPEFRALPLGRVKPEAGASSRRVCGREVSTRHAQHDTRGEKILPTCPDRLIGMLRLMNRSARRHSVRLPSTPGRCLRSNPATRCV